MDSETKEVLGKQNKGGLFRDNLAFLQCSEESVPSRWGPSPADAAGVCRDHSGSDWGPCAPLIQVCIYVHICVCIYIMNIYKHTFMYVHCYHFCRNETLLHIHFLHKFVIQPCIMKYFPAYNFSDYITFFLII